MGKAIAAALSSKTRYNICTYEKDKQKLKGIKAISKAKNAGELIEKADIVILAIKPQDIKDFIKKTDTVFLKKKPILISIAAGVPTSVFEKQIKNLKVIRVMPNLCAKVNLSTSFICKGKKASNRDLKIAQDIFKNLGKVFVVKENMMNKVTSITGSGPGYVYYFMYCIYTAACKLGFSKPEAREMVKQTFLGASKLADSSNKGFVWLVKEVASKRGTTESALKVFKTKKIKGTIHKAIQAAFRRANELSF